MWGLMPVAVGVSALQVSKGNMRLLHLCLSNNVVPIDDNVNSNYKQVTLEEKVEITFDPRSPTIHQWREIRTVESAEIIRRHFCDSVSSKQGMIDAVEFVTVADPYHYCH